MGVLVIDVMMVMMLIKMMHCDNVKKKSFTNCF